MTGISLSFGIWCLAVFAVTVAAWAGINALGSRIAEQEMRVAFREAQADPPFDPSTYWQDMPDWNADAETEAYIALLGFSLTEFRSARGLV